MINDAVGSHAIRMEQSAIIRRACISSEKELLILSEWSGFFSKYKVIWGIENLCEACGDYG